MDGVPVRVVSSTAFFALVTGAIALLRPSIPSMTLYALYVLAVLPIAAVWGVRYALPVAVASMLTFKWFWLEPFHSLTLRHGLNWIALSLLPVIAVVVSEVATRARRRADLFDEARGRLADEQAALRRVATLVAREAPDDSVFAAVAEEVGRLLGAEMTHLVRHEPDGAATLVAAWSSSGGHDGVGTRVPPDDHSLIALVQRTGRPARLETAARAPGPAADLIHDLGIQSMVGSPIVVQGRPWGMLSVGSTQAGPLPADTELRVGNFAELVATAVSNAQARAELARLADEQAALRRVATLIAGEAAADEIFAAVAEEVGKLLRVDVTHLARYDSDGTATGVASWSESGPRFPIGRRWLPEDDTPPALVRRTGRPARLETHARTPGPSADLVRELGIHSMVASPIIVEEGPWGMLSVGSRQPQPLPADTERRMGNFADLVATAISNAEGRAQLAASRSRIVATADATRRRIERDLHDGAQQRLVSLALELRAAGLAVPPELEELRTQVERVADGLTGVLDDLREISHGLHPAILSEGGLAAALRTLARRSALPVELELGAEMQLPEQVEVAIYYVVSEALANAIKHSHASMVRVELATADNMLRVTVRDDGVGGADPARGSGLIGLTDRIEAAGGWATISSRPGEGTVVLAVLPLATLPARAEG